MRVVPSTLAGSLLPLPRWRDLGWLADDELARHDVVAVNLAVAVGLPGWERIDPDRCLRTLDGWAEQVRLYTDRVMPSFRQNPERYERSEAYFRILVMITVLQRDLGVRYNPQKVPEDAPFDTADTFVHGVIQGPGGTCATLPVVYAAVGRRLGYPIRLVSVKAGPRASHQFARWEGADGQRFNVEASARGLSCPPDDCYRTGRYQMSPELERQGCFLRSKTPREELAGFVYERAIIWEEAGSLRRCAEGYAWASALAPDNVLYRNTLKLKLKEWTSWSRAQEPPGFPSVWVTPPSRRLFPDTLPLEYERDVLGLMATENLLLDAEYAKVWERMRRGEWKRTGPNTAEISFRSDGGCEVEVVFGA